MSMRTGEPSNDVEKTSVVPLHADSTHWSGPVRERLRVQHASLHAPPDALDPVKPVQDADSTMSALTAHTQALVQASKSYESSQDEEAVFRLQVQLDMQRERALMYRVIAMVLCVGVVMVAREWLLMVLV
jgi:hypothetical protein